MTTIEKLRNRLQGLVAQKKQLEANLNATFGAIAEVQAILADEEKADPPKQDGRKKIKPPRIGELPPPPR